MPIDDQRCGLHAGAAHGHRQRNKLEQRFEVVSQVGRREDIARGGTELDRMAVDFKFEGQLIRVWQVVVRERRRGENGAEW